MIKGKGSAAWRTIGGKRHYYRSRWEANFARYLHYMSEAGNVMNWDYEPHTFWFEKIKRGVRSYKPDFHVVYAKRSKAPGHYGESFYHTVWYEIKGHMDARSLTKIKRFRKYNPEQTLIVIDKKWFAANNRKLRALIPDWESGEATPKFKKSIGRRISFEI